MQRIKEPGQEVGAALVLIPQLFLIVDRAEPGEGVEVLAMRDKREQQGELAILGLPLHHRQ
jgi:hypothetical protein